MSNVKDIKQDIKDFKRLSRKELIDIIFELQKINLSCKAKIVELKQINKDNKDTIINLKDTINHIKKNNNKIDSIDLSNKAILKNLDILVNQNKKSFLKTKLRGAFCTKK